MRRIILAAALGLVGLGIYQVTKTPVDLLPEYQPPTVEVQTEALGLSAAEVEQLITVPLEQDLLVGVPFLDEIESVSIPGLSSVVMTFEPGTDVLAARQVVQERLTQAVGIAGLPAVANTPQMIQPVSSNSRAAMVKMTSEQHTPIEMSVWARWVIAPRLMGVPGVANVSIWGNRDRQLQVLVDPERLRDNGVTLPGVVRTAGNALEVSPLSYLEASKPGTGGFIDTPNQRLNIFHEQTISNADELAQVPLEGGEGGAVLGPDGPLALGDVTNVVEDHQPLIGDTVCGTGPDCLLLVIEKFPNANTAEVAAGVDEALTALATGLGDVQFDSTLYRPAEHVEASISNLGWALFASTILLVLVLFGLFWDWRRTTIAVAGVVVSTSSALLVLTALGATINLLVLVGLVVGLTAIIDDVVTGTNGIADRIRRYRETGTSAPVWTTLVESTVGVRRYALFGALVVVGGVVPLFFLTGAGAAFIPPIVLAYLLAVAVSFVVALVLTPGLCMMLLSSPSLKHRESPAVRTLHRTYDRTAPRLIGRTAPAVVAVAAIAAVGLLAMPFLDTDFTPSVEERDVLVQMSADPGTSLPAMTALATQAVEDIGAIDGVETVNAQIGRAVMSDKAVDVNEGEVWLSIAGDADFDATVRAVEATAAGLVGVTTEVTTYSDQQVRETIDSDDSDVVVRVFGENQEVLNAKAQEIGSAVADVDGVSQVSVAESPKETTLQVQVDLDKAQALGVKPGDVRRAAAMLFGGITVGNLFQEQKVFDVVVWGEPSIRENADDIRQLLIDTPTGDTIRLGDVATVTETDSDAVIRHEDVARYVDVTASVDGRDVADVNSDVEAAVAAIDFPLDHHAEVLGGWSERRTAFLQLMAVGLAAAVVILLMLQAAFRSWRLAGLAFLALPLSLVGGLVAVLFTGGTITLGVVAGLVAVLGLAARTAVAAVGHLLHLQRQERMEWGTELLLRGTRDQLAPTVTSFLGAAAVMLPVAIAGGARGLEILAPAAIAVLGGLATTFVVAAFALPIMALRFGAGEDQDAWIDDLYEPARETQPVEA
ncbi:MAG TPA: efflux RND transporter permease subunit [Nocardioidaceae bacterium]|nr:efflux RND transporter permease subunit [Nocardioidaceae bacterium]